MSTFTTNLRLELPNFNVTGWHDAVNQNFATLDTVISAGAGAIGITGLWDNDVLYEVGNRLIDTDDDSAWLCEVEHTSALTGTFAADRAANPTFWSLLSLGLVIKGPWVVTTPYVVGDVVYSVADHIVAACVIAHTSVHLRNDQIAGKWVFIADLKASVDAAAASASSASTSASTATTQAGIATTQAGLADSDRIAAAASAATATTQASNASTSASTATTQASNASTSATTATTQAGIATTQAGLADSDRIAAAASAAAAAVSAASASYKSRNRIVNPSMLYSQENGLSASTTNSYYGADQWFTSFLTSVGVITTQLVNAVTPLGSLRRYRVTVTTQDASLAAGEGLNIVQSLEGFEVADFLYGTANARQSVLRFGFKGPAGTYNVGLKNSANNRSLVKAFTITGGQANTDTVQTIVIPGDITGTWLNDSGMGLQIFIMLANGTAGHVANTWQAAALTGITGISNGIGVTGNVFELFDVGLYLDIDEVGIAPHWEQPDSANELGRCQRFWQDHHIVYSGNVTSAGGYTGSSNYYVIMRVTPSLTGVNLSVSNFAATVGTMLDVLGTGLMESRIANGTGAGLFRTIVSANARI